MTACLFTDPSIYFLLFNKCEYIVIGTVLIMAKSVTLQFSVNVIVPHSLSLVSVKADKVSFQSWNQFYF